MSKEGLHVPREKLQRETLNKHYAITSIIEELEAVDWYRQRADDCDDPELRAILLHNAREELEHAAMVIEWLRRNDHEANEQLTEYLFKTGSIAGHMPGTFQLVYNSTKAFIDDFCIGLANELKETNVVITNLMPGPTDTDFFERADMEDTQVGQQDKADPAKVAKDGYKALLDGDTRITSGFMNKVQKVFGDLLPEELVAQLHRRMAEPQGNKPSS